MRFTQSIYLLILFSFFSCKNETVCSINEKNAGKEIYDLDEASCFIALKLEEKAPKLELIRKALIAEEKYMSKIGLISENPILQNESQSNVVLETNELVQFALREENIGLNKDELSDIYDTEFEYLKFIGVVE